MSLLSELFPPPRILAGLKATGCEEIIDEMMEHLVELGVTTDSAAAEMRKLVLEREHHTGTGIGSGVAIPHARIPGLEEMLAVFGRSAEGVEFCSPDNAPVHFVCLLLVPESQAGRHLQTLAALARLFSNCELREALWQAPGAAEIAAVLAQTGEAI